MKYEIIKYEKTGSYECPLGDQFNETFYDVLLMSKPWLGKPKERNVRVRWKYLLARIVGDVGYSSGLHHLGEVINAYGDSYDFSDFEEKPKCKTL